MQLFMLKLQAYWKLGISNVLAVAVYRLQVRVGYFEKMLPITSFEFSQNSVLAGDGNYISDENAVHTISYYNAHQFEIAGNPNWIIDPFSQRALDNNDKHWSKIPDFSLNTGDVKNLWELSRFEWLIKASWQSVYEDSNGKVIPKNTWLLDWCKNNPANSGVNWKCAQECSIRAMNLVTALFIERRETASPDVLRFLQLHAERVRHTIGYAKAQDNNHGTSEAAALFVLGIQLTKSTDAEQVKFGEKIEKMGRRLLENRTVALIGPDGTFSQYSVNYHRMMLDTLSFSECVRRRSGRPPFTNKFYQNANNAAQWLFDVTNHHSGDAPNIGANDGSMLFNCSSYNYRDFRPSTQLAMKLFTGQNVHNEHRHPLALIFEQELKAPIDFELVKDKSTVAKVFKRVGDTDTYAILKCPADRFRPSQSDALHVDIWHSGENLVRDTGTYSYNPPEAFKDDLGSTARHSTIEINNRDQMPKVSRFLYGAWLSDNTSSPDSDSQVVGEYKDWYGAGHRRTVLVSKSGFEVVDYVFGVLEEFTLRWRLSPRNWTLSDNTLTSSLATFRWESTDSITVKLVDSVESRFYSKLDPVVVLEINSPGPATLTTHISCH